VATDYDIRIALDKDFNEPIVSNTWTAITGLAATTAETVSFNQGGGVLMPNTTYYWRIRVTAATPVQSPWSETRSFVIKELTKQPIEIVNPQPPVTITTAPAPPAPVINLPAPVVNIPAAPPATTITIPPAPAPQQIAPAYIWAIVVIGAVLVIAVIVLIVRTRRPV